jgi:hypothetical protein
VQRLQQRPAACTCASSASATTVAASRTAVRLARWRSWSRADRAAFRRRRAAQGRAIARHRRTEGGTSLPAVSRWVARYEEHKDVVDAARSGGPRCTDEALDTAMAFTSRVEPFTPPRGIKRKHDLDISSRTIARRLDEAGLHARLARHVFTPTDEHKRRRLPFANGYSHFTEDHWCKVILADESTFLGAGYHGRAFVRRPDGEALNPEYCLDKRPHPVQVPAWAYFTAHGPGYMAMYEGSLDGAGLCDIMRDYLKPTAEEHFGDNAEWWLLHDNDPGRHIVKSIVVRTWMHNNYVRPLDFSPYSPDLNPIENLWADVKKRMESKQTGTKDELEELLSEEWAATSPALCNRLARSMVHRIQQVIERGGAYTDY